MRRPGRPRKLRGRERNGRLQRSQEERDNQLAAYRQRQWLEGILPKPLWLDPHCSDPLGLLFLAQFIPERSYQSGVRYRDTALAYRRVSGLPSGLPKALGDKGVSHIEADPRVVLAIRKRYFGYRELVVRKVGRGALNLVHQVCATERMIDRSELEGLQDGLVALGEASNPGRQLRRAMALALGPEYTSEATNGLTGLLVGA